MFAFVIAASVIVIFASVEIVLRRRHLIRRELPHALEIAQRNGWVSLSRLMSEGHLSKRNAQVVLDETCSQGFLYQGLGDAYYLRSQKEEKKPPASAHSARSEFAAIVPT